MARTVAFISVNLNQNTPSQIIDLLKWALENLESATDLPHPMLPAHPYFSGELWKFNFDSIIMGKMEYIDTKYPNYIFNAQFDMQCGIACFTRLMYWLLQYAHDGFHGYCYEPYNPGGYYLIRVEDGKPYFYTVDLRKTDNFQVFRSLITGDGLENE